MNTTAFEQFEVMDNEALAAVEGGERWVDCALSVATNAAQGYAATAGGTVYLGPYAFGTGAIGAVLSGGYAALHC